MNHRCSLVIDLILPPLGGGLMGGGGADAMKEVRLMVVVIGAGGVNRSSGDCAD